MDSTPKRVKPHSLTLAWFNANGMSTEARDQRTLIQYFLSTHQVDIMLVNETFLKPSKKDPRIANYCLVRNDRLTSPKGGTLIYYKRSLHCIPIDTPPLVNLEASCCRLAMTGHAPITIAACYHSGNKPLLRSDLEALLSLDSAVILAGDFNSKHVLWGCNATNVRGNLLDSLAEELNFDIIPPSTPTFFPGDLTKRPDILDLALLKGIALQLRSLEVLHELDSDHRPVLTQLGPDPTDRLTRTKTVVNWELLGENLKAISSPDLDKIPDDIVTPDDISLSIDALTSHLQTAIGNSSKQVPAEDNRRWALPEDARELLRAKHAATRAYDWNRTEENRASLRYYERAVKNRIRELRNQQWESKLSEIEPTHQAYWHLVRSLKSNSTSAMPPLSRPNLPPAFEDEEKAECLAVSLEQQCSPSLDQVDPVHLDTVTRVVEEKSSVPPTDTLEPVTASEVESIIRGFHARKAPGPDGISNKVLKHFPVALIHLLVSIFNAAITNCIFPDAWKTADVIGIHKPGKKATEPSSYRPISLLSTIGKLYERILLKRIWSHVKDNNLLPDEQFGFRARHSCVQQVHRITEYILDGFNKVPRGYTPRPQGTAAVFLDVAKAFDKVWHDGLIYKLYEQLYPDRLVLIIQDFLRDRNFRYRVEGTHSSHHPINAGVPQGSALAPILYSIFTSDIPRHPKVELALFADDTALFTKGWNWTIQLAHLQQALNQLGDWFKKWAITVNPDKSAAVYFHPTRLSSLKKQVKLHGQPIPWASSTKYLGVTLDKRLNFSKHIQIVRNRAAFFLGRLAPLIGSRSKMSLRNKVTIYKTCIRPVMTYASAAFAHASPFDLEKLQIIQNRFIRRAVGASWFMRNADLHCDLELPSIIQFIKHSSRRYFDSAAHHPNPLVVEASNYSPVTSDPPPLRRRPRDILGDPDDPIAVVTSAALGSADPTAPGNRKYAVFGIGAGYQRHTITHRPRRRGRRLPRSGRRSVRFAPNSQPVQNNQSDQVDFAINNQPVPNNQPELNNHLLP